MVYICEFYKFIFPVEEISKWKIVWVILGIKILLLLSVKNTCFTVIGLMQASSQDILIFLHVIGLYLKENLHFPGEPSNNWSVKY